MYCSQCGKQIEDDSVFCTFCGEKQKLISDSKLDAKRACSDTKILYEKPPNPRRTNKTTLIFFGCDCLTRAKFLSY